MNYIGKIWFLKILENNEYSLKYQVIMIKYSWNFQLGKWSFNMKLESFHWSWKIFIENALYFPTLLRNIQPKRELSNFKMSWTSQFSNNISALIIPFSQNSHHMKYYLKKYKNSCCSFCVITSIWNFVSVL